MSIDYVTRGLDVPEPLVPGTGIPNGSYMTNDNRAAFNTHVAEARGLRLKGPTG